MHKCYPLNGCLEVVSMGSYSRFSSTVPLLLVFLMVTMSWSSVLDNRHNEQTETSLSDVVVSHVGWGSPTTLDSTNVVGMYSSLAIDSNDSLHVTYLDATYANLEYMTYDGSSWSTPATLDSTDSVGQYTSLAIDSNDNLHVTYYDYTNLNLEYMTHDGSSWSTPVSLDSTGDVGLHSSLAIDSNDNLHVTYLDSTNGNLEYMTYDGSSWSTPVSLDSTDVVGSYSSLAIDSNDNLHVTYYDNTNGNLEYMTYDGSSWSTPVSLDSTGYVGQMSSLAIDSNDNLHVTYLDSPNANLEYMSYNGSSWSTPVSLDSTDIIGFDSSLAIDSNDNLHVTYRDATNGNLEYMTYDGSSWSTPVSLDSTGVVGHYCSLAIDSNDNLHVTYYDLTNGNLEYMTYSAAVPPVISYSPSDFILTNDTAMSTLSPTSLGGDVVTWSIDPDLSSGLLFNSTNGEISGIPDALSVLTVYTISATNTDGSFNTSINITVVDEIPVISYSPSEFNLTNNTTMSPTTVPVNTGGPIPSGANTTVTQLRVVDAGGDVGEYSSFVLDSTGSKHISYYDATNGDLKYATDTTGSWVNSTIDSNGDVGQYSSITVDSNDVIHISYYDESNGDLMYITDRSGSWVNTTIDSTGALGIGASVVGLYTSIAIDSNAKVHISYLHSNSSIPASYLKYATDTTGSWVTETAFNTTSNGLIRAGHYSSIALDSNDKVHISAYDDADRDLIHVTNKNGSWVKTTVQSFANVGLYTSLAIDSNDDLHIAYHMGIYSSVGENLRYAMYNGSTGWTSIEIDTLGSVGSFASLALDSNGFVHISYYDETNQQLKYATNLNGSWELSEIDSVGNVGSHTSISVDTNGAVDISYYDEMNGNLLHSRLDSSYNVYRFTVSPDLPIGLELNITTGEISGTPTAVSPLTTYSVTATNTGGSFTTSVNITVVDNLPIITYSPDDLNLTNNTAMTILSPTNTGGDVLISNILSTFVNSTLHSGSLQNGYVGQDSSVVIDSNNAVHISYYDFSSNKLQYITNKSGSWVISTLDSSADIVGYATSIALDSNDNVHISYHDETNGDLKYATDSSGAWVLSSIDTVGYVGSFTSIVIDSNGHVHIAYEDSTNTALKYATNSSGAWVTTTVDASGDVGEYLSIDLDSNDAVHISYRDGTNSAVKHATDSSGSWVTSVVDSSGVGFGFTSLSIDSNDAIHIAYSDDTTYVLKYATGSSGSWTVSTLTSSVVWFASLSVDSNDFVHIAYADSSGLIHLTDSSGSWVAATADSNTSVGGSSSIAHDSNNGIHISYSDEYNSALKYAFAPASSVGSWSISRPLPSGILFDAFTGNLSGIPTELFPRTMFTITAANSGGVATTFINITVNAVAPTLAYSPDSLTLTNHSTITTLSPTTSGGDIVTWSIDPALSSGLTFNTANGEISGMPDALSVLTVYTISATNTGGTVTATVNITVNAVTSVLSYAPDSLVLTNNTAMSTLSPTTSGGDIVTWSIDPALSSGLTFNTANGEISGIPDALSVLTVYTISATNTGGTVTTTVNITVNAVAPVLSYSPDSFILTNNSVMSTLLPTTSGGDVVTWSIDPALSSGLLFNSTNGEISGIPDALSVLTVYTISATNSGDTVTTTVNITVNAEIAVISYSSSNLTLTRSLSMPTLSPSVAGGGVVSWEISPQLPSGLQFGNSNGSVWGASSVNMSQTQYTVWANNTGGSAEALLNITVVEPVAVIGYSPDSLTLIRTQSMTSIMPVMSGGQVETWEIEPTLPFGLSFSNGVLSGTPEVNMTLTSFTIWANNSGGASFTNITLLIHEPIPEVTYSPENIVLTRGQNITEITPSLGEGMVAIWEISPSLPDGLVFENGGISGTPVVNFTMTQYTVIAQNSGGSYNVTFNLTVVEPVAILSIESNPPVLLRDNSSLALNITNDGGLVEVWEISPSLPDGLAMENGSVSGISSVTQSETIFTIWGNNSAGSGSVTFTLTVQEPEIIIVEQLPEQEPEVSSNLFILSMIFFVPLVALIIVFKKHYELMY